jgi:hypothetical protein
MANTNTTSKRGLYAVLTLLVAIQTTGYLWRQSTARTDVRHVLPTELAALHKVSTGLRRALANVLWIRVDRYLHTGSLTKLLLPPKDDPTKTVVAAGGISAEMNARELFPLMRLVVMLDPSFVKAGVATGILLIKLGKRLNGKQFIQDLIRLNRDHPRLYALYAAVGVTLWRVGSYKDCLPWLRAAANLYPRVLDEKLLKLYGEPPPDSNEQLIVKSVVAGLVHANVMGENYDEALHYWTKSGDFSPDNVYTKVLALYTKMKRDGNVDMEELAYRVREWQAQDEEKDAQRQNAIDEQRRVSGEREPELPPADAKPIEERGIRYLRIEPGTQRIDLVVTGSLWRKFGVIVFLSVLLVVIGRRSGILAR